MYACIYIYIYIHIYIYITTIYTYIHIHATCIYSGGAVMTKQMAPPLAVLNYLTAIVVMYVCIYIYIYIYIHYMNYTYYMVSLNTYVIANNACAGFPPALLLAPARSG